MKELQPVKDEPIEVREVREAKKTFKLIGQQLRVRGHILWQFNTVTKELTPAKYRPVSMNIVGGREGEKMIVSERREVDIKKDCIYFQALNRKNAIKKLTNLKQ